MASAWSASRRAVATRDKHRVRASRTVTRSSSARAAPEKSSPPAPCTRSRRARRGLRRAQRGNVPAGLIDAELFGHAKNYPTSGMRARRPRSARPMAARSSSTRSAEPRRAAVAPLARARCRWRIPAPRRHRARSRFVLIGATNRDVSVLKPDSARATVGARDAPASSQSRRRHSALAPTRDANEQRRQRHRAFHCGD